MMCEYNLFLTHEQPPYCGFFSTLYQLARIFISIINIITILFEKSNLLDVC